MRSKANDKMLAIETGLQYFVKNYHRIGNITCKKIIGNFKIILIIEHIEVLAHQVVGKAVPGKANQLVENGKCIAHGPICFLGNNIQCKWLCRYIFLCRYKFEVVDCVWHSNPSEIINLAARQNSRDNFMFFGSSKDKFSIGWWFFQCF